MNLTPECELNSDLLPKSRVWEGGEKGEGEGNFTVENTGTPHLGQ